MRDTQWQLTFDQDFAAVIRACAAAPRPGQSGTWITDDMRQAPSVDLIEALIESGAVVRGYDPAAGTGAAARFDESAFTVCEDRYAALDGADALVICTEWNEFRSPDFGSVKERLVQSVIFDGRNLYDPELMEALGFTYYGIGRGVSLYAEGARV